MSDRSAPRAKMVSLYGGRFVKVSWARDVGTEIGTIEGSAIAKAPLYLKEITQSDVLQLVHFVLTPIPNATNPVATYERLITKTTSGIKLSILDLRREAGNHYADLLVYNCKANAIVLKRKNDDIVISVRPLE